MTFSLTDIQHNQLQNGLTILTREDHTVPIVTSMTWYRAGSRLEQPGGRGAFHFLEHMMFKGTKRFAKGEIDHLTARHGGFNNAFTSHDYTAYYFSFASDRWRPALEIEADRMCNTLFDRAEFELERQVILEELRMELDNPWEVLRQALARCSFRTHPYRYPVIGTLKDLSSLELSTVQQQYREYYAPGNATLVLVGDFDTKETLRQVSELFGPLPASLKTPVRSISQEPPAAPQRLRIKHPSTIARLIAGVPAPSISDADLYPFHLIDKLLTEGRLSRLYQRLIENDRLAAQVTSEFCETLDPFLLFIRADIRDRARMAEAEAALLEELAKLARETPTAEELQRAKKQCIEHFVNDLETTADQAFAIGLYQTLNRLDLLTDYCEKIAAVTPEEIASTAMRRLHPGRVMIGTILPAGDGTCN